jgi:hypothetical protein
VDDVENIQTEMEELASSSERIERHFFAASNGEQIDLHQLAETWIARAS